MRRQSRRSLRSPPALVLAASAILALSSGSARAAEPVTVLAGFGVQFMQIYVADKQGFFEERVPVTVK